MRPIQPLSPLLSHDSSIIPTFLPTFLNLSSQFAIKGHTGAVDKADIYLRKQEQLGVATLYPQYICTDDKMKTP